MPITSKEAFLALREPPKEILIPEWEASVYIRLFSVKEREQIQDLFDKSIELAKAENKDDAPLEDLQVLEKIIVMGLCDAEGARLFPDSELSVISDRANPIMNRLGKEILNHNGIGVNSEAEAVKNSEPDATDDSSLPSPATSTQP